MRRHAIAVPARFARTLRPPHSFAALAEAAGGSMLSTNAERRVYLVHLPPTITDVSPGRTT